MGKDLCLLACSFLSVLKKTNISWYVTVSIYLPVSSHIWFSECVCMSALPGIYYMYVSGPLDIRFVIQIL